MCSNRLSKLITATKAMSKVCVNMWRVRLLLLLLGVTGGPTTMLVAGECFGDGGVDLTVACSSQGFIRSHGSHTLQLSGSGC